jgi:hypothetical protein
VIQKNWQDLIKPNRLEIKHGPNRRREATPHIHHGLSLCFVSCDHLSSTLSCSNCPLCCRPSVFLFALLRGLYGGTVAAMDAIPSMPVEEHQVLDPRVVRQPVNEIELRDCSAAPTSLLGIECANPHESPCAGLLAECGVEFRDGHLRYLFGYHKVSPSGAPVNT